MRATLAVVAIIVLAVTGCGSDEPEAAQLAAQACGDAGTSHADTSPGPNPSGGVTQDDVDTFNRAADDAAAAAARDPRWTQLAANLSWWAEAGADEIGHPYQVADPDKAAQVDQKSAELDAQCRIAHAAAGDDR
ncbi:hypothetical protein [Streptomyces sp. NPDC001792]|uniref:hypothetical protein n=1 Tax=unclassified Streptomyces TaxID=2593676 RepID=UPI00331A72C8